MFRSVGEIQRYLLHTIAIEIEGAFEDLELSETSGVPLHEGGDAETPTRANATKKEKGETEGSRLLNP